MNTTTGVLFISTQASVAPRLAAYGSRWERLDSERFWEEIGPSND